MQPSGSDSGCDLLDGCNLLGACDLDVTVWVRHSGCDILDMILVDSPVCSTSLLNLDVPMSALILPPAVVIARRKSFQMSGYKVKLNSIFQVIGRPSGSLQL